MQQELLDRLSASLPDVTINSEIKRGGQKVVYRATYRSSIPAVFKVVLPSCREEHQRALREISIASQLQPPLFAKLYNCGEFEHEGNSVIYIIEEIVPGVNLRDRIAAVASRVLPVLQTRSIISSILDALDNVESLKLVHRDIKPENIMVSDDRTVLIDFGIARQLDIVSITPSCIPFGPMTPGYAPPEQIHNEKRKISIRTDLFSLGVVFYELLVGYNPFAANMHSVQEVVRQVLTFNPPTLNSFGFHPSFDTFIGCTLSKHCHRRPSTVAQAKTLFNNILWEP